MAERLDDLDRIDALHDARYRALAILLSLQEGAHQSPPRALPTMHPALSMESQMMWEQFEIAQESLMSNVIPFPKRPSPKRLCQEHLHRIRERVEQRLGEKLALMAAAGDPGTISLINRPPNMKELVDAYYRAHPDGNGPDAA